MPGPKFRQICQNAEHSEATGITGIVPNIAAWGNALLSGVPFPNITWTIDPDNGTINVFNDPQYGSPHNVTMWHANSYWRLGLRDWRLIGGYPDQHFQDVLLAPMVLNATAPNSNMWVASRPLPESGWTGFFVEIFFKGIPPYWDPSKETMYRLTTQISIIPYNVWPFPDCYGVACFGDLM